MIDEQTLDDILGRWGSWAAKQNNQSHLGIKIAAYAERIGSGSWGGGGEPIDSDVIWIDSVIHGLSAPVVAVLWLHYCVPGPVKSKIKGSNTDRYYGRFELAKAVLLDSAKEKEPADMPV